MSPVALKTVVAGGVVYPAGTAVPDHVAEGISAPGVFRDDEPEAAVAEWANGLPVATVEEIAAAAAALGLILTPAGDSSAEGSTGEGSTGEGDDGSEGEAEALAAALPGANGNDDGSEGEGEDEGTGSAPAIDYSTWTVDKLKEEISTRNSYREPDAHLSTSGKKAELAAVLAADDEA